jgi:hypothetical protein
MKQCVFTQARPNSDLMRWRREAVEPALGPNLGAADAHGPFAPRTAAVMQAICEGDPEDCGKLCPFEFRACRCL